MIKDMVESTTGFEVAKAIEAKIRLETVLRVHIKIREFYSDTLAAITHLPAVVVKKLLSDGKIKIK